MQSENLRKKIDKSLKIITNVFDKSNKRFLKFFILFLFILAFLLLIFLSINLFSNINFKKIETHLNIKKESIKDNLFKMAEKDYEDGFLENSAIKYMNYLNQPISKREKILAYKKLFEISVKQKRFESALGYLNEIEKIDRNVFEIYIYRLKLFLRNKNYEAARKEIEKNSKRLNKSVEFKELLAVYYDKIGEVNNALNTLISIKFNKRNYSIHKNIIIFYLKLGKPEQALKYLESVEGKLKILLTDLEKAEFFLLKGLTLVFLNKFEDAIDSLKKVKNLDEKYDLISNKFILLCKMHNDNPDDIYEVIGRSEELFFEELSLIKLIANYYIQKKDYKKAIYFYEKLAEKKELSKDETATFADIYYMIGDYENSIKYVEKLFLDFKYDYPVLYKNLSFLYSLLKNKEKEIFFLKEGINKFPDDIELYIRIAKFYIDNSQSFVANRFLDKARAIYNSSKTLYSYYAKQIELLIFLSNREKIGVESERDLLILREKSTTDPSAYFKTIEFYIKKHKYLDVKREIDTVNRMKLSEKEKEILANYQIIYLLATDQSSKNEYGELKSFLLSLEEKEIKTQLNVVMMLLVENDFDMALKELEKVATKKLDDDLNRVFLYLQALCYYYKQEFALALKILRLAEDRGLTTDKNSYLKSLVLKKL